MDGERGPNLIESLFDLANVNRRMFEVNSILLSKCGLYCCLRDGLWNLIIMEARVTELFTGEWERGPAAIKVS